MTSGPENPDSEQEPDSVQDENYLLGVRRQKLQNLRDRGIDPYPHSYDRSHTTAEALALFEEAYDFAEIDEETEVLFYLGYTNYVLGNVRVASDFLGEIFEVDTEAEYFPNLLLTRLQKGRRQTGRPSSRSGRC